MAVGGHLFIVQGDIRHLHCDAWLLPCDTSPFVAPYWWRGHPELAQIFDETVNAGVRLNEVDERTAPLRVAADKPTPILGAIPVRGTASADYAAETVRQFVRTAGELPRRTARAVPLLAVPSLGTGFSGGYEVQGELLEKLIDSLRGIAVDEDVDLVLVLNSRSKAAAARAVRRALRPVRDGWSRLLGPQLIAEAQRLADHAERGRLVLFMGAGVGVSAGLPAWSELLRDLAGQTDLDLAGLSQLSNVDQALLVQQRLGGAETLGVALAKILSVPRYGLVHALLANLPVAESITLNYDDLFERASVDVEQPVSVLPYEPAEGIRWLLKLHGSLEEERRRDIVLTRGDYLRLAEHRASLTGLLQALLITRHMLFVGFGLTDDHFHTVMHDVRRAVGDAHTDEADRLGTALLVGGHQLQYEIWKQDLVLRPMTASDPGRQLEVFLDLLAELADAGWQHVLDGSLRGLLRDEELELRNLLLRVLPDVRRNAGSAAWAPLFRALEQYGM